MSGFSGGIAVVVSMSTSLLRRPARARGWDTGDVMKAGPVPWLGRVAPNEGVLCYGHYPAVVSADSPALLDDSPALLRLPPILIAVNGHGD